MSKATTPVTGGKESVLERFPEPRRETKQAIEERGGDPHHNAHTDADSIRRFFSIPKWDPEAYDWGILPDCLVHTWDASPEQTAGGTDLLATGKPGSGKSTQALHFSERLLEVNDETVVWRGSPSRSEWLPLAPWATLCLPAGADVEIRLEPRDPRHDAIQLDVEDLERIVREVRRYEDTRDLLEDKIAIGQLNVVFPDPYLRGCQELYQESHYRVDELEFSPDDPPKHWWFGFALSRVYHGPHHWMTWIADEIGDLAPESASKDEYSTLQKIELLKDLWVDARKHGLSVLTWGHSEIDVHHYLRHKMRWRITLPPRANPTAKSEIVGFNSVPMDWDLTSQMDLGEGLLFNEANFQRFTWPDYPTPVNYKLKIRISKQ